jgi:serine/threonine protein kinase
MVFELVTGDLLFDPHEGDGYDRDEGLLLLNILIILQFQGKMMFTIPTDHLAQFQELLGRMPKNVAFNGKYSLELFNRKGELRNIRKLKFWDLHSVLSDKYRMAPEAAASLASFLLPMLEFDTTKRATAAKMLQHPWVDVQQHAKSTSPPRSVSPSRHSGPVSPVTSDTASQKNLSAGAGTGASSPSRLAPLLAGSRAATAPHQGDRRATLAHTGMDASAHSSVPVAQLSSSGSTKRLQPLSESLQSRTSSAASSSSHSPIRLVGQVLGGMGLLGSSSSSSREAPPASASPAAATAARGGTASPTRLAPIFSRTSTQS